MIFVTQCVAIRFCLCRRHSDDLFGCFGAKPTQRTEDEISRETGSGGGKEGVKDDRESHLTTVGSRGELAVQIMRQSAEGGRRRWKRGREESQQKSERRLLRPVDQQRLS